MLHYSLETAHEVVEFLTKNGLISLTQKNELKKLAKEQKMTELDAMLKFFPENEEQLPLVIQKIHKLTLEDYYPAEGDEISRLGEFLLVKRKADDPLVLAYDPQTVVDYFNYLVPSTVILTRTHFEGYWKENTRQAQGVEVDMLASQLEGVTITGMTEVSHKEEVDEEISEDAVKQLDKVIRDAIKLDASDVHIEIDTDSNGLMFYRVRYRTDGKLKEAFTSNNLDVFSGILTQIKLRSGLKLDETRMPQDGRMNYSIFGAVHSFRISTKPIVVIDVKKGGEVQMEKIVIRKMPDVNNLGLAQLGNTEYAVSQLNEAAQLANGFNIITGPTGSGKTTLLYAILSDIDTQTKNVSTIEDPVEAEIKEVNQTQVLPEIGLNFARVLRAELRQDPDIIMVGEMRDKETAEIAAEASLTGHLVFSTLHTNDAVSSVTRLINMGLPPFIVSSALAYCVAQRLVRKLCPECKQLVKDKADFKKKMVDPVFAKIKNDKVKTFFKSVMDQMEVYQPKEGGCPHCLHTGYKGRTAILEVFKIDEKAENIILKENANESMLYQTAIEGGMMTMEQDGLVKVMRGVTSHTELYTVLVAD